MEQKKRVGIWIRVSTERQVEDESPEHHELRARMYAEAKGWEITEVYRLDGVSGKSTFDLPITKKMFKDLRSGRIEALVFSKLARLGRNTKELLEFAETFQKEKADLISLAESIDTSSPAGRMFFTVVAAIAQWEREEIAARVAASVPIRAQLGKPLGGAAPYGYRWKDKEIVIEEKEAPVRKLMYELFIEYKRKRTVASKLNALGYRTRNGSKFSDTTVGRLLHDSTAKGIRIANYTKSLGEGKAWTIKPESEWVTSPCPAIVSEALWEECNAILRQQEEKNKRVSRTTVHLLSGLLRCGCGGKMYVYSESDHYKCGKCRKTKIGIEDIEEIYYENLKKFLLTDEHIEQFAQNADEAIAEKENQFLEISKEKKKLETDMKKTMQLYLAGQIAKDDFGKHYNPLSEKCKQLENALPELQAEIDLLKMEYKNNDAVLHDAQNLYDRWNTFTPELKRNIVEQITDCITIAGDEITMDFDYNPALFQNPEKEQRNLKDS